MAAHTPTRPRAHAHVAHVDYDNDNDLPALPAGEPADGGAADDGAAAVQPPPLTLEELLGYAENPPLVRAVRTGNEDDINRLLQDTPIEEVQEALWWAITLERNEFGALLIQACGESPVTVRLLCLAAFRGALAFVQIFVGIYPDLVHRREGTSDWYALDFARNARHAAVVDYLVSQRASERGGAEEEEGDADVGVGEFQAVEPTIMQPDFSVLLSIRMSAPPGGGTTVQTVEDELDAHGAAIAVGNLVNIGDSFAFSRILPCGQAGRGAFGVVQRGWYGMRQVAYKQEKRRMGGTTQDDISRMTTFVREARVLRVLQEPTHTHCLTFLGVGVDVDAGVAIVTEYVAGGSLRSRLQSGPSFEALDGLQLCAGLAAGLLYIHETGIVHGDIKPDNILLESASGCSAKIIDFGGAYPYWRGKTAYTSLYAAPEVAGGGLTEARSDVFSLACVLYEVLTGLPTKPRKENYAASPIEAQDGGCVEGAVEAVLPEELQGLGVGSLLSACWSTDACDRPTSQELYKRLLSILQGLSPERATAVTEVHEAAPPSENSPLMAAVQYGDTAAVSKLLSAGHKADHQNRWGHTPVHVAAAMGDGTLLRILLRGDPGQVADAFGTTPIEIATQICDWDMRSQAADVISILSLAEKYRSNQQHSTAPVIVDVRLNPTVALQHAASSGDIGRARLLLDRREGAVHPGRGVLFAFEIACAGNSVEVVAELLPLWRDFPDHGESEWTALLHQVYKDSSPGVMRTILSQLPSTMTGCWKEVSKLFIDCCRTRHEEWVRVFVVTCGDTPSDRYLHVGVACGTQRWLNVLALLECDRDNSKVSGASALIGACQRGMVDFIPCLLASGIGIDDCDSIGATPLMRAAEYGELESVNVSLDCGASIGASDIEGNTVLMYGCASGNVEVAEALVAAGCDVNSRSGTGETALLHACFHGNVHLMSYLLATGADVSATVRFEESTILEATRARQAGISARLYQTGGSVYTTPRGSPAWRLRNTDMAQRMLANHTDVNKFVGDWTSLEFACFGNQLNTVRLLLDHGASVRQRLEDGRNAFMIACDEGFVDIAEALFDAGATVDWRLPDGSTALLLASARGDLRLVTKLADLGADLSVARGDGRTALMEACRGCHTEVARFLLVNGAEVDAIDGDGITALTFATMQGLEDVAVQLIEGGADIGVGLGCPEVGWQYAFLRGHHTLSLRLRVGEGGDEDVPDTAALGLASARGHSGVLRALLELGVDVNGVDGAGHTALMLASEIGRRVCVEILLERGASTEDQHATAALQLACTHGHRVVVAQLIGAGVVPTGDMLVEACENGHAQTMHVLLEAEVDTNSVDELGRTALMVASEHGRQECVHILLERGTNTEDHYATAALQLACLHGHRDVVTQLINAGAVATEVLLAACESALVETVRVLLDVGVDANLMDEGGRTALMVASEHGHQQCVRILLERDANTENQHAAAALELACTRGHREVAAQLIAAGVVATGILLAACENGDNSTVGLLLAGGVDANSDERGRTALMMASKQGHRECVRILLEGGASTEGLTARDALLLACLKGHSKVVNQLIISGVVATGDMLVAACENGHVQAMLALLEAGVDANYVDDDDGTALMVASEYGNQECARILLEGGANTEGQHAATALQLACTHGHHEVVVQLIDAGVVATGVLLAACENDHAQTVRLLLEAGVDVNSRMILDRRLHTPLTISCERGCTRVVEELLLFNANVRIQARTPFQGTWWGILQLEAEILIRIYGLEGLAPRLTPIYLAVSNGHHDIAQLLRNAGATQ